MHFRWLMESNYTGPGVPFSAEFLLKNLTILPRLEGPLPEEPVYVTDLVHPTHDYSTVIYSGILAFGFVANVYLMVRCLRPRKAHHVKERMHLMHVVVANLLICFFTIPVEIGWRWTIEWRAGNVGCKALQFARVLGLYGLTHNLAAIAVDKVVEVRQLTRGAYPCSMAVTRGIFAVSWICSLLCSCPQLYIFHAGFSDFSTTIVQCVGIESFSALGYEELYNAIMLTCMFLIPWTIMILSYVYIFHVIKSAMDLPDDVEQYALTTSIQAESTSSSMGPQSRPRVFSAGQQSRTSMVSSWGTTFSQRTLSTSIESNVGDLTSHIHLRSTEGNFVLLDDSFERNLRIFSTISGTTVLLCLPYISFTIWYLIDSDSHSRIHPILQELPFVLVLANTLLVPAVYALKLCVTF